MIEIWRMKNKGNENDVHKWRLHLASNSIEAPITSPKLGLVIRASILWKCNFKPKRNFLFKWFDFKIISVVKLGVGRAMKRTVVNIPCVMANLPCKRLLVTISQVEVKKCVLLFSCRLFTRDKGLYTIHVVLLLET